MVTRLCGLILVATAIVFLFISDSSQKTSNAVSLFIKEDGPNVAVAPNARVDKTYETWRSCVQNKMMQYRDEGRYREMWVSISSVITECSEYGGMNRLRLTPINNEEEIKYQILPKQSEPIVFVTLGVGKNIIGEADLRKRVSTKSLFFGADPIKEENQDLYSQVGSFYPYAVSAQSGIQSASVLLGDKYVRKDVLNVEFLDFLKEMVKEKVYDAIWMDNEYAEYDLLPYFFKNGTLDQAGIIVCQWNLEVHIPVSTQMMKFQKAIFQYLDDGVYAILRCVDVQHLRLYLVNFRDEVCVDRYLTEVEN